MVSRNMKQFPITYTMQFGRVAFGWGAHETVADECKGLNIQKAFITTTGLKGTGIVDEITGILARSGIETTIFDKITSNPKDHEVMEAYKVFKESGCDGVVSVGGGSSHDVGKGVRAVCANDGKYVCDMAAFLDPPWMDVLKYIKPVTLPQISVNTTAGTGAESTNAAAIINTKVKGKELIVAPGIEPSVALIDPLLIRLMPQHLTAWTGFDALTHAFESYLVRTGSPLNSAIELHVMKMIVENLREFTFNRMNHVACENMCWAASMAGLSLMLGGGVGIVHGLGHGLSALYDCHHGLASAAVTLPLERYNLPSCPGKFAEMAGAIGVDTSGMTKMQAADAWFDEMERLLADLSIKTGDLNKRFGLQQEDLEHMVRHYENDFAREGNPRDFVFEDCVRILEEML